MLAQLTVIEGFMQLNGIKLVGLLLVGWDRHVTVTEAGLMNSLQAITTSLEHTPTKLSRTYMQLL